MKNHPFFFFFTAQAKQKIRFDHYNQSEEHDARWKSARRRDIE